jgi:aryl-alcohol dehydrogenase-like predicted oxidoreductase
MTFGSGPGFLKVIGTVDQNSADELVKGAYDRGVNFFDTADVYQEGESEKTLGQSFKNPDIPRNEVVITTKVYKRVGPGRNAAYSTRIKPCATSNSVTPASTCLRSRSVR